MDCQSARYQRDTATTSIAVPGTVNVDLTTQSPGTPGEEGTEMNTQLITTRKGLSTILAGALILLAPLGADAANRPSPDAGSQSTRAGGGAVSTPHTGRMMPNPN